jgi:hypothetical protein
VVNVEGHQEGTAKGYNPKKLGNNCYDLQLAFCDEIKAFLTGYVSSGDTYTSNGTAEMIKDIIAQFKKVNRTPAANQDLPAEYIFLAGKIIRSARSVVMRLSEKYPYREMYEMDRKK